MKSFSTIALACIAAMASATIDPPAIMYSNSDCTGDIFFWNLHGRDEIRQDYYNYFVPQGWNDKGQSIQVPAGYTVRLSEHGMYQAGTKIDFVGQVEDSGRVVCQDLGELRNKVSDSIYSNNYAKAIQALTQDGDALREEVNRQNQLISDNASEIDSLNSEINLLNSEIDSLQQENEALTNEIAELDGEQIIEEYFYSNPQPIKFNDWANERDYCFDAFSVSAGETLDLDAYVRVSGVDITNNKKAKGRLMLVKNGSDRVAQSWFATRTDWDYPGTALNYREKPDADATYTLCFTKGNNFGDSEHLQFVRNSFNWGYKIRGSNHNLTSLAFSKSDLTQQEEKAVWHGA